MTIPYNNSGLRPEQIEFLDETQDYFQGVARRLPQELTETTHDFNIDVARQLRERGVDLDNPREFAAAVTAAAMAASYIEFVLPGDTIVAAGAASVLNAMMSARPLLPTETAE